MTRFKVAAPNTEVRLRKWPAGRLSQLRLMLGHLQQTVNNALAAQVAQSPSRKFSEFVPVIPDQDIEVEVEFREIRVKFTPPRGLRKFLFYEFQISASSNFANFDQFESAEPYFVFTDLEDAADYFIRIRVVTTDAEVGPFSATQAATTPESKAQGLLDETTTVIRLDSSATILFGDQTPVAGVVSEWNDVYVTDITPLGGTAYYSIDYELRPNAGVSNDHLHWADVEMRWLIAPTTQDATRISTYGFTANHDDFEQVGEIVRFTLFLIKSSTLDVDTDDGDNLTIPSPLATRRAGTLVQKVLQFTSGTYVGDSFHSQGDTFTATTPRTIKLQARIGGSGVYPTPGDWTINSGARRFADQSDGPTVSLTLRNFNFFEVLTGATS